MRSFFSIILYLLAVLPGYADNALYKPLTLTVDTYQSAAESCIGVPVTPICALKTWRACLAGFRGSCTSIGIAPSDPWKGEQQGGFQYDIRIVLAYKFTPGVEAMLPSDRNPAGFRWAGPGSIVMVYEVWGCSRHVKQRDCNWMYGLKITVSPKKNRWMLTAWEPDNAAECEHFVPESESGKSERYCAWYIPDAAKNKIEQAFLWPQARGLEASVQIDPRSLLNLGLATNRDKKD